MSRESRRLLVLGGTAFVGRAIVEEALRGGHEVTLFNRGITNPGLFPAAEKLRGDRASDLSALTGRRWHAVIDVAAYHPGVVERSIEALRNSVERYVWFSTLSVYANHSSTTDAQREHAAVLDLAVTDSGGLYGARKAACEAVVLHACGERATVARAGLIVGPHDPTDRFAYWPRRMAAGGRVLAPGNPDDPLQFIDVRDLAQWLLHAAFADFCGVVNVTGQPVTFAHLLEQCRVPGVDAELVWVSSECLLAAGVEPWMGVPLWIGETGWEAANAVDVSRALASGLRYTPLNQTIGAALAHSCDTDPLALPVEIEHELLTRLL